MVHSINDLDLDPEVQRDKSSDSIHNQEYLHEDQQTSQSLINEKDANSTDKNAEGKSSSDVHPESQADVGIEAPDGGWGWMVVVGCMLGHLVIVGSARAFGIFYVALIEKFESSATTTSLIPSLFNFVRMGLGPVVSWLCDRFTVQKVVIAGGLVYSAGCVASAFAPNLIYLTITYGVIAALGAGCIFTPMFIILSQYFDKNKGKAMAFATLGSGVGTVIMAQLVTFFLGEWGYYGAMLMTGGMVLNCVVAGALFRPLPTKKGPPVKPNKMTSSTEMETVMKDVDVNGQSVLQISRCQRFLSVLQDRLLLVTNVTFVLHCLTVMSMPFCVNLPLVFLPPLVKEYGLPDHRAKAALLISVMSISDMVGRFFFGFIFDLARVRPYRRPFHTCLGLCMGVLVCLIPAMGRSVPALLALCIAWGFVEAGFHSQRATIQSSFISKEQMSNSVGFMILFQGIGNITAINLGGVLADAVGSYKYGFIMGGLTMVLFASLFLMEYFICKFIDRSNRQGTVNVKNTELE